MRSLFHDIHRTVMNAMERAGYSGKATLKILRTPRSWYYVQLDFSPLLDGRFNSFAVREDDEWIVIGYRRKQPEMSFREIAYTLIDEDLTYLSPQSVYRILKKHDLITEWHMKTWPSTRP